MGFKRWLEARVSSEDVGEAMKRTLEMVVDGDWKFMGGERRRRLSETEHSRIRLTGFLKNDKTRGEDNFILTAEAEFDRSNYDSLTGRLFLGDVEGERSMKISCILQYGRKDFEGGVQVSSIEYDLGSNVLKTPMELARWVRYMVDNFKGFGSDDDDDDDEDEPEWSPSVGPAQLVGA